MNRSGRNPSAAGGGAFGTIREHALAALAFVLLASLLVLPGALGDRSMAPDDLLLMRPPLTQRAPDGFDRASNQLLADAAEVFHPDLEWTRARIRDGESPIWNSRLFGGYPILASQQTAQLHPFSWLAYLLPFWQALTLIGVLTVALAGFGTWLFCRGIGLGRAPAALAGISFSLSAYFIVWLEHPHAKVYAMLPLMLWAIDRLRRGGTLRDAAVFAAFVGVAGLAGHPGSAMMIGIAAVAYAAFRLKWPPLGAGEGAPTAARTAVLAVGAAAAGLLACSVVLIPFVELAGQSMTVARGGSRGHDSAILQTLALPELWGRPDRGVEVAGPVNFVERTIYAGVLPLLLAAVGMLRRRRPEQWFFASLALGSMLFVIDMPFGLTSFLAGLPPLSLVALTRAIVLVVFAIAVLAAIALQDLIDEPELRPRATASAAVALAALPLLWAVLHADVRAQITALSTAAVPWIGADAVDGAQLMATAAIRWSIFAAAGLLALWLLTRARTPGRRRVVLLAIVALVAVDLVALGRGFHPVVDRATLAAPATPSIEYAREHQGHDRVIGDSEYLIPNSGLRYGLRDARGHELPVLRRYLKLYNAYGGWGYQGTRYFVDEDPEGKLLGAFGVGLLLTGFREQDPPIDGLKRVLSGPDERVYEFERGLPRAYGATGWRVAGDEDAARAAAVASSTAELRERPVVEGVSPPADGDAPPAADGAKTGSADGDAPPAADGAKTGSADGGARSPEVAFVADEDTRVELRAAMPAEGFVVLLDTYYPGWVAKVDGDETPIRAANGAFRAVAVPAGEHRVEFEYRPSSVRAGAAISALVWLALLLVLVLPARRPASP